MKRTALLILWIVLIPMTVSAANFSFKHIRGGVYAAIAEPGRHAPDEDEGGGHRQ